MSSVFIICNLTLFCVRPYVCVQSEVITIYCVTCDRDYFDGWTALVDRGLLIVEASRSPPDAPHSVGLLWTSDQLDAETFSQQHTTQETGIHSLAGFEPAFPASERPQTHALHRAFTRIGFDQDVVLLNSLSPNGAMC